MVIWTANCSAHALIYDALMKWPKKSSSPWLKTEQIKQLLRRFTTVQYIGDKFSIHFNFSTEEIQNLLITMIGCNHQFVWPTVFSHRFMSTLLSCIVTFSYIFVCEFVGAREHKYRLCSHGNALKCRHRFLKVDLVYLWLCVGGEWALIFHLSMKYVIDPTSIPEVTSWYV